MEEEKIEKPLAECKKITDAFRASLKPAIDENGQVRMGKLFYDSEYGTESENIEILETTSEQVQNYIANIQGMMSDEIFDALNNYFKFETKLIIDCSFLYIKGNLRISGKLPSSSFQNTTFLGSVNFSNSIFYQTNFSNVLFMPNRGAIERLYKGYINFSNVVFLYRISFENIVFSSNTEFGNTTFSSKADFNGTTFLGMVDFRNSTFSNDALFSSVVFSGYALFSSTTFSDYANFNNTTFLDQILFDGVKFLGIVKFSSATLSNQADFTNTEFKDTTNFENTTFTIPPIFQNAELHSGTSFGQPEAIARNFGRCETQRDYMAYRALKQHMNKVQARLEESMFFALEQKTKRTIDGKDFLKNWSNYLISLFYDLVSGYGQNTARPIIILLISGLIVFPAIYWALDDILEHSIIINAVKELKDQNIWGWYQSLPVHLGYSLQSIFNPLVFFNKDSAFIATNPFMRFVSSIQSMFTIAVFALWLLAVRNRFQKGS